MELNAADVCRLYAVSGAAATPVMVHRILGDGGNHLFTTFEICATMSAPNVHTRRNDIAYERKMRRAHRVAQIIMHIPFVRAIAVCNSLGLQTVHETSDIDFFIIAARGRVWTVRFFTTALLTLARMRPGEASRDPVCTSFFVDETVSDMSHLMIERDIYFEVWLRTLIPLYGTSPLFARGARTAAHAHTGRMLASHTQIIAEYVARVLPESLLRRLQWRLMPLDIQDASSRCGTNVMCTDGIIKLHVNDRRVALRDAVYSV